MLHRVGLAVLLTAGAILWINGLQIFLKSRLSRLRKILWSWLLVAAGVAIGFVLPEDMILTKFVLVLLILPFLAVVDVLLGRSQRRYAFWLRACGFEVCTVFGSALGCRYLLGLLRRAS